MEGLNSIKDVSHDTNSRLRTCFPTVYESENDVLLPRRWDSSQASAYLEISRNGSTVSFKKNASLHNDKDPYGVVRADAPIPFSVGLYYFEIKIVHGHRGCMGVGLSKAGGELNRMPGWDPSCYGYHGDDGNFFYSCGNGTPYGPKFGTGDVIGCGIDTMLHHVFFTKNGKHLGVAFQGSEPFGKLYPTVGLKTPGEQLNVNFGDRHFVFDFESYCQILNKKRMNIVEKTQLPQDIGNKMDRIVSSFLGNSGAFETLSVFKKISNQRKSNERFLKRRKEIVDMIMNANYGAIIYEKIDEYYPGCLEQNLRVQLVLFCLRYIDLANTLLEPPSSCRKPNSANGKPLTPTELRPRMCKPSVSGGGNHSKRNRQNGHNSHISKPSFKQPSTNRISESGLNDSKILERFTDEDTGEEMIRTECFSLTNNMYNDLYSSEQYEKMSYIMKMGREIMKLSNSVNLTTKERQILETSMTMVITTRRVEKHPLSTAQRRYIANLVTSMINNTSTQTEDSDGDLANVCTSYRKVYSELRGMFVGWKGLHLDASARDHPSAAIAFMKKMVIRPEHLGEAVVDYAEELMEQSGATSQDREEN